MNDLQKDLLCRVKFSVNSSEHSSSVKAVLDLILSNEGALPTNSNKPRKEDLSATLDAINDFVGEFMTGRSEIWHSNADSKGTMALLISSFFALNPAPTCPVCKAPSPETLSLGTDCLRCLCCGLPAHTNCYKEVNPNKGIYYICTKCNLDPRRNIVTHKMAVTTNQASQTVVPAYTTDSKESPPAGTTIPTSAAEELQTQVQSPPYTENTQPQNYVSTDNREQTQNDTNQLPNPANSYRRNRTFDRSLTICKYFESNRCKYGIAGGSCPNYHPPYCRRFRNYGPCEKLGCTKSDEECNTTTPPSVVNL
eukprot:sb/3467144/